MANLSFKDRIVKLDIKPKTYGDLREACVNVFLDRYVQPSHFYIFEGKVIRKPSDILKKSYVEIVLADGVHRHLFILQFVTRSLRFRSSLRYRGNLVRGRFFSASNKVHVDPDTLFQDDLQIEECDP